MSGRDKRITPTHEAGHVAAAWCLAGDAAIRGPVTCVEEAWTGGSATVGLDYPGDEALSAAWYSAIAGLPPSAAVRDYAESMAMIFLAGGIAEVHAGDHLGKFEIPTVHEPTPKQAALVVAAIAAGETKPEGDWESTKKLLRAISASDAEADSYLAWLMDRTWRLVLNQLFGRIVDALVPELVAHPTLERDEVLAIIHRVVDPPPFTPFPKHSSPSGYEEE